MYEPAGPPAGDGASQHGSKSGLCPLHDVEPRTGLGPCDSRLPVRQTAHTLLTVERRARPAIAGPLAGSTQPSRLLRTAGSTLIGTGRRRLPPPAVPLGSETQTPGLTQGTYHGGGVRQGPTARSRPSRARPSAGEHRFSNPAQETPWPGELASLERATVASGASGRCTASARVPPPPPGESNSPRTPLRQSAQGLPG